jgi:hypothetical protein
VSVKGQEAMGLGRTSRVDVWKGWLRLGACLRIACLTFLDCYRPRRVDIRLSPCVEELFRAEVPVHALT